MHKPNYGYEKRQKELKKQKKQEEKRQRKLEKKADLLPGEGEEVMNQPVSLPDETGRAND